MSTGLSVASPQEQSCGMGQVWFRHCSGMVLVWFKCGPGCEVSKPGPVVLLSILIDFRKSLLKKPERILLFSTKNCDSYRPQDGGMLCLSPITSSQTSP